MSKLEADLVIRNASELLTLASEHPGPRSGVRMNDLGVIEDGAVAVSKGRIIWIGKSSRLSDNVLYSREAEIVAKGRTVIPGFVDSHTHVVFTGSREDELELKLRGMSYLEILRRGGGILRTVEATRRASEQKLAEETRERLDTMLIHGTTTIEAKSGYGLSVKDEVKMLEVIRDLRHSHPAAIIPTFLGAHATPREYGNDSDSYVELITSEMIPRVAKSKLAFFSDVFCEKGVFSKNVSKKILTVSSEFGLKAKVHADEFSSSGGAELAAEVSATSADHLIHSTTTGLKKMAEAGVIATVLPTTPFSSLLGRYANYSLILQSGCAVAIATDLSPNSWTESMQTAIALACFEMKMTPAQAIVAATINGAYALDIGREVGSIEVGKLADIIILHAPNHRFLPYHYGVNLVETVVKAGKVVVSEGRLLK